MELVTQAEYARINNISRAAVTQIKEKLVYRPHPVTGKLMVDREASDIATGRKADPTKQAIYQKQNNRADESATAAAITIKSKAQFEHYKAQNEKLKYETESGKYLLKSEVEKADFEKARITRDKILAVADRNCDILAIKDNPHEIKIYLREELTRAMNEVINELEILASDDE